MCGVNYNFYDVDKPHGVENAENPVPLGGESYDTTSTQGHRVIKRAR